MEPAVPLDVGPAARRERRLVAPNPGVALALAAGALLIIVVVPAGAGRPLALGLPLVHLLAPFVDRLASFGPSAMVRRSAVEAAGGPPPVGSLSTGTPPAQEPSA